MVNLDNCTKDRNLLDFQIKELLKEVKIMFRRNIDIILRVNNETIVVSTGISQNIPQTQTSRFKCFNGVNYGITIHES